MFYTYAHEYVTLYVCGHTLPYITAMKIASASDVCAQRGYPSKRAGHRATWAGHQATGEAPGV